MSNKSAEWINLLFKLLQPKLVAGKDIVPLAKEVFFKDPLTDFEAIEFMKTPGVDLTINSFKSQLQRINQLDSANLAEILKTVQTETGNKGKMLFMPLRIALTSKMHGPDFNLLLLLLGKQEILKRLG